jgi:plastocyanin
MFTYLANQIQAAASLRVQRNAAAAGAINGTGVDIGEVEGPVLVMVDAPLASAGDTINFTVEHSEDNVTFTAVAADILVNPDTGVAATFTQVTAAVAVFETLALKRERLKRYVRVVATTAGAAIDVTLGAWVLTQKKYY